MCKHHFEFFLLFQLPFNCECQLQMHFSINYLLTESKDEVLKRDKATKELSESLLLLLWTLL